MILFEIAKVILLALCVICLINIDCNVCKISDRMEGDE